MARRRGADLQPGRQSTRGRAPWKRLYCGEQRLASLVSVAPSPPHPDSFSLHFLPLGFCRDECSIACSCEEEYRAPCTPPASPW